MLQPATNLKIYNLKIAKICLIKNLDVKIRCITQVSSDFNYLSLRNLSQIMLDSKQEQFFSQTEGLCSIAYYTSTFFGTPGTL